MKYIKLFEDYSGQKNPISVDITTATSGFGTDEDLLLKSILRIADQLDLRAVNAALANNPDSEYKSVKAVVDGELGIFDSNYTRQIEDLFKKIGLPNYLKDGIIPNTLGKKVEVSGEYRPSPGDWDAVHSFQSRRSDGFGGRMNDIVEEALVKFWSEHGLNPDITKIEIKIDEVAWKVSWKCTIEESKDGKAWVGLTSRGGAGQADGPSGSIQRAEDQIERKKSELKSEVGDPGLETKEVLDFNYDSTNGNTHIRQIFIAYTNPEKYKPY